MSALRVQWRLFQKHQHIRSSRMPELNNWNTEIPQNEGLRLCLPGIVHENVKMGSDGESDHASGTSSDEVQSPVRVRMRNNHHRRISNEVWESRDRPHRLHENIQTLVCQKWWYREVSESLKIDLTNPHVLAGFCFISDEFLDCITVTNDKNY